MLWYEPDQDKYAFVFKSAKKNGTIEWLSLEKEEGINCHNSRWKEK